jgi:hypothetical protein
MFLKIWLKADSKKEVEIKTGFQKMINATDEATLLASS